MSDVITNHLQAVPMPAIVPVDQPAPRVVTDRRRPGRAENVIPELIALMRKPTPEAIEQIALYDAPNFVLPDPSNDGTQISLRRLTQFGVAFGICAAGWVAAFKLMMMSWG